MIRYCEKYGSNLKPLEEHHIIPKHTAKYFGITNADIPFGNHIAGRIILCKDHHDEIHNIILHWIVDFTIRELNPNNEFIQSLKDDINVYNPSWEKDKWVLDYIIRELNPNSDFFQSLKYYIKKRTEDWCVWEGSK